MSKSRYGEALHRPSLPPEAVYLKLVEEEERMVGIKDETERWARSGN